MESDGKFVAEGRHDILVEAIGNLSIVVVFVQLDKGLELNYILEFQNDNHPPPPKRTKLN